MSGSIQHYRAGGLQPEEAGDLLPSRRDLWPCGVISSATVGTAALDDTCSCLSRKVSRYAGAPCRPGRTRICLDVFHELGLLSLIEHQRQLHIHLTSDGRKVNLDESVIIRKLKQRKAGE